MIESKNDKNSTIYSLTIDDGPQTSKLLVTDMNWYKLLQTMNKDLVPDPIHLTCIIGIPEVLNGILYQIPVASNLQRLRSVTFLVALAQEKYDEDGCSKHSKTKYHKFLKEVGWGFYSEYSVKYGKSDKRLVIIHTIVTIMSVTLLLITFYSSLRLIDCYVRQRPHIVQNDNIVRSRSTRFHTKHGPTCAKVLRKHQC